MTEPELLYEAKGQVAWITINREVRRNALSLEIIDLFNEYLDRIEADDQVRVICLTAKGEKAFCSGADLAASFEGADHAAGARKYAALLKRLLSFSRPIVARLNGHCLAGGMGLMLCCDVVYAQNGVKIGTPEVNVGLFPMMIGAMIFRNAGRKKALEMIYTARLLTAAEAEEMGLITRAVAPEDLDRVVTETLEAISAKAPLAIRFGRQALAAAEDLSLNEALDYLCEKLGRIVDTEDAREGLLAFFEKRKPEWKGR
jgi:enoyl-CoA hydratase/carnithine racemase